MKVAEISGEGFKNLLSIAKFGEQAWLLGDSGFLKVSSGSSNFWIEGSVIANSVDTNVKAAFDSFAAKKLLNIIESDKVYEILLEDTADGNFVIVRRAGSRGQYKLPLLTLPEPWKHIDDQKFAPFVSIPAETFEEISAAANAVKGNNFYTATLYTWFLPIKTEENDKYSLRVVSLSDYFLISHFYPYINPASDFAFGILNEHIEILKSFLDATDSFQISLSKEENAAVISAELIKFLFSYESVVPAVVNTLIAKAETIGSNAAGTAVVKDKKRIQSLLKLAGKIYEKENAVNLKLNTGIFEIVFSDSVSYFKERIEATVWGELADVWVDSQYLDRIVTIFPDSFTLLFDPEAKFLVLKSSVDGCEIIGLLACLQKRQKTNG